jgi:FtsP/CotA-like multicopper oxidase with cupredoxin domain
VNGRRGFLQVAGGLATGAVASAFSRRAAAQAMPGMSMPASPAPASAMDAPPVSGGKAMPMSPPPPLPRGAPPPGSPLYKRFALELKVVQHEIVPGYAVHMMAYNGQVPAPTIRVNEGDWVWVDFTNASDEMHTIHWHGLILDYRYDGVPYVTQDPVMRGEKFPYVFQAKPYGTHFYHCHFGTVMHMQAGMYGALIVERPDDPIRERFPYTQDYTFVVSSFDALYVREQMNAMFARMRQRDVLAMRGALDLRTQNRFGSLKDLVGAIARGYVPSYMRARTSPRPADPTMFLVNGHAYPATEPVRVREGEWTRLRFINAGGVLHSMHMHGHDFFHVCSDGSPLPAPTRGNTLTLAPGKTEDIVFLADNPGFWALHDHDVSHTVNNGVYPGGVMTHIEYEGFNGTYAPSISLDE